MPFQIMVLHKTFVTLLAILFSSVLKSQNGSDILILDSILNVISVDNRIEQEYISNLMYKSEKYKAYRRLKEIASERVLIELTNHKSPAVRGYAFMALVDLNSAKTYTILRKHKRDKEIVYYLNGCIGGSEQLRFTMNMMFDIEKHPLKLYQEIVINRLDNKEYKLRKKQRVEKNKAREEKLKDKK